MSLAGWFSIANDVDTTATTSGIQNVAGIFNQSGGTATIGTLGSPVTLLMGNHLDAANSGLANATMNLTGGTLNVFGDTTVSEGTLTLSSANSGNDASTVTIADAGATLNLTYTGTDKVDKLFIGANQQANGVYGKSGSVPPIIGIPQITGDGTLTVGPVLGFSAWITGAFSNGTVPAGKQGPNDDPDNDGIRNLVEYSIAGQDPTVANGSIGTFTGGTLSFTKRADASGITYDIESSTTLDAGSWATLTKPPVIETSSSVSYTLTPGTPARNFIRLKVTLSP